MAGDEGMAITVSYPKETYFPIKFNGFDVGGLVISAVVPAGAKVKDVHALLWAEAKRLVQIEFDEKLELYVDRIKQCDRAIEGHAFKG